MNLTGCAGTLNTITTETFTRQRRGKGSEKSFFYHETHERHEKRQILFTMKSMKVNLTVNDIIFKLQFLHALHGETAFLILYILSILFIPFKS